MHYRSPGPEFTSLQGSSERNALIVIILHKFNSMITQIYEILKKYGAIFCRQWLEVFINEFQGQAINEKRQTDQLL